MQILCTALFPTSYNYSKNRHIPYTESFVEILNASSYFLQNFTLHYSGFLLTLVVVAARASQIASFVGTARPSLAQRHAPGFAVSCHFFAAANNSAAAPLALKRARLLT